MTIISPLEQQIKELQREEQTLTEQIGRLQTDFAIATDTSAKFKFEKQLEMAEQDRSKLQKKIVDLENRLYAELGQHELENLGLADHIRIQAKEFEPLEQNVWDYYEQIEWLGQGAIAEVYKVRKLKVNAIIALKLLQAKHHADPRAIARFWAEGRITGLLGSSGQHHIVRVLDMGRTADHRFFIEMELIEGVELSRRLAEVGLFSCPEVIAMLRQIALALQHAHTHRVIHRDVKPHNMIIGPAGRLTLIDFGIAKRLDVDSVLSQTGTFVGSYGYAAPEQFEPENFGRISERTDIYALGILAYELLTGELPFQGSPMRVGYAHCTKPLPEIPDECPPGLAAIIRRCTEKEPADRFQNTGEVLAALDALLEESAGVQYRAMFTAFAGMEITPAQRQTLDRIAHSLDLSEAAVTRIEAECKDPQGLTDSKPENQKTISPSTEETLRVSEAENDPQGLTDSKRENREVSSPLTEETRRVSVDETKKQERKNRQASSSLPGKTQRVFSKGKLISFISTALIVAFVVIMNTASVRNAIFGGSTKPTVTEKKPVESKTSEIQPKITDITEKKDGTPPKKQSDDDESKKVDTAETKIETPTITLRSQPMDNLSSEDAKKMVIERGFADTDWNQNGKGIDNQFEAKTLNSDKVVIDHTTGLMWQQGGSSKSMNYEDAQKYVTQINKEKFGGYFDWRLPTLEEAMSLMEKEKLNGDLYIDPVFDKTQSWIWTADMKSSSGPAFTVAFDIGYVHWRLLKYYVRLVRSGH